MTGQLNAFALESETVSTRALRLMVLVAAALVGGCAAEDIAGSGSPESAGAGAPAAAMDVAGTWSWSNEEEVSFPPFLAFLLGVVPEGDLTHARCASTGSMTVVQTGATFEGTAQRLTNACLTDGGQPFTQPGTSFLITDGRVTGGAVHFSMASPTVSPCPHTAVITEANGDAAARLSGKGWCLLPGHPRSTSAVAMDPPPQGRSRTTSWEAARP